MNLSKTIIYRDVDEVNESLRDISNLNYIDEYGYTPLIQTTIMNDAEKAALLLESGADPNYRDVIGGSALHWAVQNQNSVLVHELLKAHADPNAYYFSGKPVLAQALLNHNEKIKRALIEKGASLQFAQDYIYTKLIGHRFELLGSVDIVDPDQVFVEVDYEGFYLTFSVDLIADSLHQFCHHFAARSLKPWLDHVQSIYDALQVAQTLANYDHYLYDITSIQQFVFPLLSADSLILPFSQEAHSATFVKHKYLFAICDRNIDYNKNNAINIFMIHNSDGFEAELILKLLYEKQEIKSVYALLCRRMALEKIGSIPLSSQVSGNCSWANVEAAVITLDWMLRIQENNDLSKEVTKNDSLELFYRWREWDRQRALQVMMGEFQSATPARKAFIASVLSAVLFQSCSADNIEENYYAYKIIPLLKTKGYEYILESYIEYYVYRTSTKVGDNLLRLLANYEKIRV